MAVSPANAAAAYQQMAKLASGAVPSAGGDAAAQNFGAFLNDAMKEAVGTMQAGETAAAQGTTGKGDIVQVVNAVTAAELTLETVVAIRDRVIGAYQDIMKMPI